MPRIAYTLETVTRRHLEEVWEPTAHCCPHCASRAVWTQAEGEEIIEPRFLCLRCGLHFHLDIIHAQSPNEIARRDQRLLALRPYADIKAGAS